MNNSHKTTGPYPVSRPHSSEFRTYKGFFSFVNRAVDPVIATFKQSRGLRES
jgi:hypothetical protein